MKSINSVMSVTQNLQHTYFYDAAYQHEFCCTDRGVSHATLMSYYGIRHKFRYVPSDMDY